MRVIEPLWTLKTETASRLRGRIENILGWATVREYRAGDNPARWRGHLQKLLPAVAKVAKVQHHPALPYTEIGSFMDALRARPGIAPRCLEFIILTACRVGEAVGATWAEVDFDTKVWTVPADRMKAGREHRVPLSEPAVRLLKTLHEQRTTDYVFAGWKRGSALSTAAPPKVLEDMGRTDITAHGFRSTFRDWCAEQTSFPRELAEAALAHVLKDKTEAAYQRGDLLERRRKLMDAWAAYCDHKPGEVVQLKVKAAKQAAR